MTLIGARQVAQVIAGPGQVHVRLLATTDLHAHLLPFDYFTDRRAPGVGLARLAEVIAAARSDAPNTLLFDNGDTLQGTPLADAALVEMLPTGRANPMISAMNTLGYDAATLGNHDFDFGLPYLESSLASARFPLTLANADRADGTPFLPPHLMLQRRVTDAAGQTRDLKVGVVGAVPPQVAAWSRAHVEGRVRFADITTSVAAQVAALRGQGADLVVVLAHSGLGQPQAQPGAENVALQLAALDGVDAVIAGHTHDLVSAPAQGSQAPIVQPAAYGTHLGVIDLLLDPPRDKADWWAVAEARVATPAAVTRPRAAATPRPRLLGDHADLRQEVAQAHRTTQTYVSRALGESAVPLHTFFSTVAPCAATQVVADAQKAAAMALLSAYPDLAHLPVLSAAAPFRAGGRTGPDNYTDISAGALKLRHAADLYIYPNALCVLRISGAGLADWLERSVSLYRQIDPNLVGPQPLIDHAFAPYNFDRITGVRYRIDVSQPPRTDAEGGSIDPSASRIRDLRLADGRPVQPGDDLLVVTNSYRAAGGGHMPAAGAAETVLTSSDTVRDAVARYISEADAPLAPVIEPTFSFVPLGGVPVVVETGSAGCKHASWAARHGLQSDDAPFTEQGFARFRMDL